MNKRFYLLKFNFIKYLLNHKNKMKQRIYIRFRTLSHISTRDVLQIFPWLDLVYKKRSQITYKTERATCAHSPVLGIQYVLLHSSPVFMASFIQNVLLRKQLNNKQMGKDIGVLTPLINIRILQIIVWVKRVFIPQIY